MSVLFQTCGNTGKLYSLRNFIRLSKQCKFAKRKYSDVPRKFTTFDEVANQRRAEARRSIVVQVNSESSFSELFNYCSKYASINGIHHYKNNLEEHFMLIEFSSEDNLKEALRSCSAHQKDHDVMALQSPFLWFRAVSGKKEKIVAAPQNLTTINGSQPIDEEDLAKDLFECETMSQQIQMLYDKTKLNDLGIRLRYMVARQLETVFRSLYSNIVVRPFGSTVNGFGSMGCDLDLVLTNHLTEEMTEPNKRLVFQEKKYEGGRSPWQRHMELVAELIELRVAGASRVQRILHARVPIVKYTHELAAVDCDLCYNNMSGVYMSELLSSLGSLDPRTRALTFVVRRWARAAALTNHHPGRWITNFPLSLMVIFFLQQDHRDGRILPSLNTLVRYAGKGDIRIAEENINCTFLRDMNKLPPEQYSQNTADLETLLLQFFEFYSQFDFQEKAISIVEGTAVRKPNELPLYIVNPLQQALNVSRNVSYEECERLKLEIRNAAWQLEANSDGKRTDDWGLIGLIEKKTTRGLKKLLRVGNSHRLVSMKDLFTDENISQEQREEGVKEKLERLTKKTDKQDTYNGKKMKELTKKQNPNPQKINFKNSQVAREVQRIRRNKIL